MTLESAGLLVLVISVAIYLLVTLIFPEKF
jgi:K+-transporting ATPase KdpF subunit